METLSPSPLLGWWRQANLNKFYLVSIKKIPQWPCLHRHFSDDGDKNLVSIKKILQWRPCLHCHFLDDGDKLTSTNPSIETLSPSKRSFFGDIVSITIFGNVSITVFRNGRQENTTNCCHWPTIPPSTKVILVHDYFF